MLRDIEAFAKRLKRHASRKRIKKKKYPKGIRAAKPFQLLHMDLTQIRSRDGACIYISFVVDNYSRTILGWKASLKKTSEFVDELMHLKNHNPIW